MKANFFITTLRWIRTQIIGILIAIVALLVAAVYAAPYSPSAFGYSKYDVSCSAYTNGFGSDRAFCVRVDTTTGEASCKYTGDVA
jgi:hypothetical protein